MAKIGRNAPCPCGSGKKYKRCCLSKKQEEERIIVEERKLQDAKAEERMQVAEEEKIWEKEEDRFSREEEEEDEYRKEVEAFWKDFSARDYEGKKAAFLEKLEDEQWMKVSFDMLEEIYREGIGKKNYREFDKLLVILEEKWPEIYKKDCHFYLKWQIKYAIAENLWDIVSPLVMKLAKKAHKEIDEFDDVKDWLEYYGQLPLLVKATKAAWAKVEKSSHIIPSAIDEFATISAAYLIFEYLEKHPSNISEDELFQNILYYGDFERDKLRKYISHITGEAKPKWNLDDFHFSSRRGRERSKESRKHLYYLSIDFLGYLRREANVPYTKGETVRHAIHQYILERHAGELEHRESMLQAMMRERSGKPKPKRKKRKIEHILCPDRETLDRYLFHFFHFLGAYPHSAAAVFELIPKWLSFLESNHLLDQKLHQSTLDSIKPLKEHLLKILRKEPDGATLEFQIQEGWKNL